MERSALIDEIMRRVEPRLAELEQPLDNMGRIESKAVTLRAVRQLHEQGCTRVSVRRDALVTPEAQDYLAEKRMTVRRE